MRICKSFWEADELLADIKANISISKEELRKRRLLYEAEEESLSWAAEMKKAKRSQPCRKYKKGSQLKQLKGSGKSCQKNLNPVQHRSANPAGLASSSNSRISSNYGYRYIFGARQFHAGIDIPAAMK